MTKKKAVKRVDEKVTDIIFEERKDGKFDKLWLNAKGKEVRSEIVDER